jgi:hypothetical protein
MAPELVSAAGSHSRDRLASTEGRSTVRPRVGVDTRMPSLDAGTDVTAGIRTKHDIVVAVRTAFLGFEIAWLVECKTW